MCLIYLLIFLFISIFFTFHDISPELVEDVLLNGLYTVVLCLITSTIAFFCMWKILRNRARMRAVLLQILQQMIAIDNQNEEEEEEEPEEIEMDVIRRPHPPVNRPVNPPRQPPPPPPVPPPGHTPPPAGPTPPPDHLPPQGNTHSLHPTGPSRPSPRPPPDSPSVHESPNEDSSEYEEMESMSAIYSTPKSGYTPSPNVSTTPISTVSPTVTTPVYPIDQRSGSSSVQATPTGEEYSPGPPRQAAPPIPVDIDTTYVKPVNDGTDAPSPTHGTPLNSDAATSLKSISAPDDLRTMPPDLEPIPPPAEFAQEYTNAASVPPPVPARSRSRFFIPTRSPPDSSRLTHPRMASIQPSLSDQVEAQSSGITPSSQAADPRPPPPPQGSPSKTGKARETFRRITRSVSQKLSSPKKQSSTPTTSESQVSPPQESVSGGAYTNIGRRMTRTQTSSETSESRVTRSQSRKLQQKAQEVTERLTAPTQDKCKKEEAKPKQPKPKK